MINTAAVIKKACSKTRASMREYNNDADATINKLTTVVSGEGGEGGANCVLGRL
jgi:hypothetical protein